MTLGEFSCFKANRKVTSCRREGEDRMLRRAPKVRSGMDISQRAGNTGRAVRVAPYCKYHK